MGTLTLDLWTKKSTVFKIGLGAAAITFLILIANGYFNLQILPRLAPFYFTTILICGIYSGGYFGLVLGGMIGIYRKDGELLFSDNYLAIDGNKIPLNEIKFINLKMAPRIPQSNLLQRNLATVGDISGNVYKRLFVIKSHAENEELEKFLSTWRSQGVGIYTYYNGI